MSVRSAPLFNFFGNSNAEVLSAAVPAGHIWLAKCWQVQNDTGANCIIEIGAKLAADGNVYDFIREPAAISGQTIVVNNFVVLVAGDKIRFKSNTTGNTCASVYGAILVLP